MKILLFIVGLFGFFSTIEVSAMTDAERTQVLSLHNLVRQEYRLASLSWDASIAKSAQKWADTMAKTGNFAHSSSKSRNGWGENIYMISGTYLKTRVESDAVMYWANEVQSYDLTGNTCISGAVCGHFTQIIWSSTRRIGCAKSTRKKGNITSIYMVCQYDPAGNIIGQRPL